MNDIMIIGIGVIAVVIVYYFLSLKFRWNAAETQRANWWVTETAGKSVVNLRAPISTTLIQVAAIVGSDWLFESHLAISGALVVVAVLLVLPTIQLWAEFFKRY